MPPALCANQQDHQLSSRAHIWRGGEGPGHVIDEFAYGIDDEWLEAPIQAGEEGGEDDEDHHVEDEFLGRGHNVESKGDLVLVVAESQVIG